MNEKEGKSRSNMKTTTLITTEKRPEELLSLEGRWRNVEFYGQWTAWRRRWSGRKARTVPDPSKPCRRRWRRERYERAAALYFPAQYLTLESVIARTYGLLLPMKIFIRASINWAECWKRFRVGEDSVILLKSLCRAAAERWKKWSGEAWNVKS